MTALIFETIAKSLSDQGYCVVPEFLSPALTKSLLQRLKYLSISQLSPAGIGRDKDYHVNQAVRTDHMRWLDHSDETERRFLSLMYDFQQAMNEQLFLGLFDYEAHFAHYAKGAFYKKHVDAFRGRSNRVISSVFYLNPDWSKEQGGELVIYAPKGDEILETISPEQGKAVFFLSEEFPHEVKPAQADRYSIAGWFHIRGSR